METTLAVLLTLLVLGFSTSEAQRTGNQLCLLVPPETEDCYQTLQGTQMTRMSAQVACLRKLLWNFNPDFNMTVEDFQYVQNLPRVGPGLGAPLPGGGRGLRRLSDFRVRKEYRTLTPLERNRLHYALNVLYQNGTIRTYARLHADAFPTIHRGAAFLAWHRVFLFYFEEELRKVDPTVVLPYWDSTADDEMSNPTLSMIWSSEYFGNGLGEVTSGPFANWVTNAGPLQRNFGNGDSRLIKKDDVRRVLRNCNLREISRPTATLENNLEYYHDGVHRFVGGDMASAASPYDPIFYFHHAYIDLVWERFRERQRAICGVNPETDYPDAGGGHGAQDRMAGFEWFRNIDGIADFWTRYLYSYERPPNCPICNSPLLYCSRRRGVCVARRRGIIPFSRTGAARSATELSTLAASFNAELDMHERSFVPRPGTEVFRGPPSDGRTRHTVIEDLARAESAGLGESSDAPPTSPRPTFGDVIIGRGGVGPLGSVGGPGGVIGGPGAGVGGLTGPGIIGGGGGATGFPGGATGGGTGGSSGGFRPAGGIGGTTFGVAGRPSVPAGSETGGGFGFGGGFGAPADLTGGMGGGTGLGGGAGGIGGGPGGMGGGVGVMGGGPGGMGGGVGSMGAGPGRMGGGPGMGGMGGGVGGMGGGTVGMAGGPGGMGGGVGGMGGGTGGMAGGPGGMGGGVGVMGGGTGGMAGGPGGMGGGVGVMGSGPGAMGGGAIGLGGASGTGLGVAGASNSMGFPVGAGLVNGGAGGGEALSGGLIGTGGLNGLGGGGGSVAGDVVGPGVLDVGGGTVGGQSGGELGSGPVDLFSTGV